MNNLILNRSAHSGTLQFSGEIDPTAFTKLDLVGQILVRAADTEAATTGDKLRALAELFDAAEGRCK